MTDKQYSLMVVAGEASGDLHGASLAASLRRLLPGARIWGVGGRRMRHAGVDLIYDSSAWGAIGITESLKVVPRLLVALAALKARLRSSRPDVLVLIDFGAFNVRLGRYARILGIKVMYYFPPGSWYRGASYSSLDGAADRVVTPFPWSAVTLQQLGYHADFYGHPLLDVVEPELSATDFHSRYGYCADHAIVGLLPGSRKQEIVYNLPALMVSAARLAQSEPSLQFAVPLAPNLDPKHVAEDLSRVPWIRVETFDHPSQRRSEQKRWKLNLADGVRMLAREDRLEAPDAPVTVKLLPGMAWDVLAYSRAAVVASGTATVESMILGCPMVIMYRGSWLTRIEYRLLGGKIRFIGMPNIIMDRVICPELIDREASPARIAELMGRLIADTRERADMVSELMAARHVLGERGAVEKAAQAVLDLLEVERTKEYHA